MQRDLFQPRDDTQTSMVLLRRLAESEVQRVPDYPIFFAVTKKIGHDKRKKTIFVCDANGNDVIEEITTVEKVFEGEHEVEVPRIERPPICG